MRTAMMSTLALVCVATQLRAQESTAAAAPAAAPPAAAPASPPATAPAAPPTAAAPAAAAQPGLGASLGLYVFPAKSQTPEQQAQDEQACYAWSKEQSGIDPATVKANPDSAMKAASAKVDTAAQGAAIKGAARGAAGGAVVGAIAGDAGTGAGVGAVVGAASGRRAKKQAKKQAETQAAQQANAWAAGQIDTFKKGMTACLEGKGYTVK
ncbi:MAG TPA: glycine zipper domain-containing protein [Gemmatimonadales bacterium]